MTGFRKTRYRFTGQTYIYKFGFPFRVIEPVISFYILNIFSIVGDAVSQEQHTLNFLRIGCNGQSIKLDCKRKSDPKKKPTDKKQMPGKVKKEFHQHVQGLCGYWLLVIGNLVFLSHDSTVRRFD